MKRLLLFSLFLIIFVYINAQNKIPIEYNRHIYLKGSLNGAAKSNFVFDTGAHNLYIDSSYYAESGLKFEKFMKAVLPGAGTGKQNAKIINDKLSYSFAGNIYQPQYGVLFQLRPILGDFADGIIGKDYFAKQCIEVNYEENYMKKYSTISEADLTGFTKLEGNKELGELVFPITLKLENDIIINDYFFLDLGSGGSVNMNSARAEKYNLETNIKQKIRSYTTQGGVGGESKSYTIKLLELNIAGYTLKDFHMGYSLNKTGALAGGKRAGIFGSRILDRFTIIIDFKNNNLYLKPNNNLNKPFDKTTFGFSFTNRFKSGYWIVTGFYEGFPAESSGLKVDDKIIEVNGIPVKNISTFDKQREILNSNTLRLKVERGKSSIFISIKKQPWFQ